jgi:hypothetical protein
MPRIGQIVNRDWRVRAIAKRTRGYVLIRKAAGSGGARKWTVLDGLVCLLEPAAKSDVSGPARSETPDYILR